VVSDTGRRARRAEAWSTWKKICMRGAYFLLVRVNPCGEGRRTVVSEPCVGVDARWTVYVGGPQSFHAA
jgi:hypothetical protein